MSKRGWLSAAEKGQRRHGTTYVTIDMIAVLFEQGTADRVSVRPFDEFLNVGFSPRGLDHEIRPFAAFL